jgi:hypothetical protein
MADNIVCQQQYTARQNHGLHLTLIPMGNINVFPERTKMSHFCSVSSLQMRVSAMAQ